MGNLIGKELGRYHILEQLGEGGMATVYKAFDTRLECDVAVKVISTAKFTPEAVARALKRFEREAKALARLTHPNIVKVTDYGEYEGKPYLVMPFLAGGNLKQLLKERGRIPWQEAARLLLPIAQALEFAHGQKVIHRDVKPSNILLTQSGQPMLTDFGVAKVVEEEATVDLTGTAAAVGTPEYMAPEQTGKNIDHRVDIYALGIVFYEMITGRRPYEADTPLAVLVKQASEPLPRPSQFVLGLPEAVEKMLLKALAKKPEDRYQSMGEFAANLESLTAISITAKTKGSAPKRERPVKPEQPAAAAPGANRRRWIPLAVLVVILVIGLVVGRGLNNIGKRGIDLLAGSATITPTQTSTLTLTSTPTDTLTPTLTFTDTATFTPQLPAQPKILMAYQDCDPRTDTNYCNFSTNHHILDKFYETVENMGATLDYQIPTSVADLNDYDVVIADYCSSLGDQETDIFRNYILSGGSVIVFTTFNCLSDEGNSGDLANHLTQNWGIKMIPVGSPGIWFQEIVKHPITVGIHNIYSNVHGDIEITQPSKIVVGMGKYNLVAVYDGQGTIIAMPVGLFEVNDEYASKSDNFIFWKNMLTWLIEQSRLKRH